MTPCQPLSPRRLLLGLALWIACALPAGAGEITHVAGSVELGSGEPAAWQAARAGDEVAAGDAVRTGDDGRAEIALGRSTLRLYPNSLLRVPADAAAEPAALELERGGSIFDVLHRGGAPFEVRTPEVVVSVKGTRFAVNLDSEAEAAAVAVYRGLVGVHSALLEAAHETLVREGFSAVGSRAFELTLLDGPDPWDAWSGGSPLPLPAPEALPAPARAALPAARAAALESARSEAVARAAERHPAVRERVEAQARRAQREGLERSEDRDPVVDAKDGELRRNLEEGYIESWLSQSADTDPSTVSQLDISFLDGSGIPGDDRVVVTELGGSSWTFFEDDIEDVLEGEEAFPSALVTLLEAQGVSDPTLFAQQLHKLFE